MNDPKSEIADLWFEESLIPTATTITALIEEHKSNPSVFRETLGHDPDDEVGQIMEHTRGILRVDRPRWIELSPSSGGFLTSGQNSRYFLVRLGFQFDTVETSHLTRTRFIFARCSAFLRAHGGKEPSPSVYEILPRELYDGDAQKMNFKIGPNIKIGGVEVSIGELAADLTVGTVEPVVVGWPGENERAPYWELRPKSKSLIGLRHLWLVIESPNGCSGVELSVQAEGDLKTKFGSISVGPKSREHRSRPSEIIG
jgi:hypothetical protein